MTALPAASVSLDLDNQWSYMKTHGDAGWEGFPSYLDVFVPHALDVLDTLGLRITVFVVGQDAALDRNRPALAEIARRGHEVGNHSFHHEQWMLDQPRDGLRREILEAGAAIEAATGVAPTGYRGPGFCWSPDLLDVLAEAGYLYDASTLPTYVGPLARWYYFRQSRLTEAQRRERKDLFGGFGEGRRPLKPYRWRLDSGRTLIEMPVTTMPVLRTPFHLSYLLHLSRFSTGGMMAYLRAALALCRATGTEPSFLLHPLDLLGPEQAPQLGFFPGMDLGARRKREVFDLVLREIQVRHEVVPLGEHARRCAQRPLPERPARDASWGRRAS
jgi:hypothetical protein